MVVIPLILLLPLLLLLLLSIPLCPDVSIIAWPDRLTAVFIFFLLSARLRVVCVAFADRCSAAPFMELYLMILRLPF